MSERTTLDKLVEKWKEDNKVKNWVGRNGVKNLDNLLRTFGYQEGNFKYGTVIETFLSDYPGAIEALVNWIKESNSQEFEDQLKVVVFGHCHYCGGNCPNDENNSCEQYVEDPDGKYNN